MFLNTFDACLCIVAPTYIPRNFRLMQVIDGTTAQFAWDPPVTADEVNIRGVIKAYQVVYLKFYCLIFACYACRLNCFELMIQIILFVLSRIFHQCKLGQ